MFDHYSECRWKQQAITKAGSNAEGNGLNQLSAPFAICSDDQYQTVYIADCFNHRVVTSKSVVINNQRLVSNSAANNIQTVRMNRPVTSAQLFGCAPAATSVQPFSFTPAATNAQVVAGGNGPGDRTDQLNGPTDVIIDRQNNSFIIADQGNRRVIRWPCGKSQHGQIFISDIDCSRLTMHEDGSLYVSDCKKNEVRRWKKGETQGTLVVNGNGEENQLNYPTSVFVDSDHTLYICDRNNHRVMKWAKDAKEGIVAAGGNGQGNQASQLSSPEGVIVDQFGDIYVADFGNDRVMRWYEGAVEGSIVVGGNGKGQEPNQLNGPVGLSFDNQENLYVVDYGNHRIQKFEIERNETQN